MESRTPVLCFRFLVLRQTTRSGSKCPVPVEKFAEGCSAVTVLGFLFWGQFGEGFLDGWKIKERVVSESVRAAGGIEEHAFGLAAKRVQGLPIASSGDHTNETASAVLRGNFSELADQAGVVGLVVSVVSDEVRLVGR